MEIKNKVYIIAEAGINHNGSLDNCYKLIDVAKTAGCDAVKFQFFSVRRLYPHSAGRINWKDNRKRYSYDIYTAIRSFEIPISWSRKIMAYCRHEEIDFLSSVFDEESLHYLICNGIEAIKLASSLVTNLPFIAKCAHFKKPIIMSTGASTLGEVDEAIQTVNRYHNMLSLLHCTLKYPTNLEECNLGVIQTLRYAYPNNIIGYSDHTQEVSDASVQAIYLGAKIIEKHITLNKKMKGPDHFFALEPHELKGMVRAIRKTEQDIKNGQIIKMNRKLYGSTERKVYKYEEYLRNFCFATIFAAKDIKKGERIGYENLIVLRPGRKERGLEPKYLTLFKQFKICAVQNISKEEAISWEKIFYA